MASGQEDLLGGFGSMNQVRLRLIDYNLESTDGIRDGWLGRAAAATV